MSIILQVHYRIIAFNEPVPVQSSVGNICSSGALTLTRAPAGSSDQASCPQWVGRYCATDCRTVAVPLPLNYISTRKPVFGDIWLPRAKPRICNFVLTSATAYILWDFRCCYDIFSVV